MITQAAGTSHTQGFETLDEEVIHTDLAVQGALPEWLTGTLVRVTPAQLDVGGVPLRHWFDGLAMLNAFELGGGGGVSYGSRYLETEARRGAQQGELTAGFAQDPCRSIFKRVMALAVPPSSDNANVNLVRLGERYLAMTEVPMPVEFDPHTLETLGVDRYKDGVSGQVTTAHPHYDRERDEALNYVVHFGARSAYKVYGLPAGATERRVIAKVPARKPAYMHSFGMSEHYVVLAEFPLVVEPIELALSGKPFIDCYRWEPQRGTRFTVVDRHTGELRGRFEGEPFFCFHHVNAYERGSELVVDLCAYDDPSIIGLLEVERLRSGDSPPPAARLQRCVIDLESGRVAYERLSEESLELPRINYPRVNTREYRYAYGAGNAGAASVWLDQLVKADVGSGESRVWSEDGCHPGEPVFVARPGGRGEDDGIVLSVVLDTRAGRSFLLALDAGSFEEVARAEAPQRIPFGFHGQFFSA